MSTVVFNSMQTRQRLLRQVHRAQEALDSAVLQDSNYFIPKRTGALEQTGIAKTVIGSGRVIWETPYARRLYYGVDFHFSKQKNINACAKWFEAAKARFFRRWKDIINDYF